MQVNSFWHSPRYADEMPCEVLQYFDNVPSLFDYIIKYVVPNKT